MAWGIDVDTVWVDGWFQRNRRPALGRAPWSRIGREGGVHSLELYSETNNVCVKL